MDAGRSVCGREHRRLRGGYSGDWVEAYAITGDGATAKRGEINQSAYQDYLLVPIIARNTAYRVRARVGIRNAHARHAAHQPNLGFGAFTTAGLSVQARRLPPIRNSTRADHRHRLAADRSAAAGLRRRHARP
jgi:hypothetical protein